MHRIKKKCVTEEEDKEDTDEEKRDDWEEVK